MSKKNFKSTISLQGEWLYRLDPQDQGIKNQWFNENFTGGILRLPGTLCENGIGKALDLDYEMTPSTVRSFRAKYEYIGACWYQKKIEIPKAWTNKRIHLFMERAIFKSEVWIDDKYIGNMSSLVGAHEYDLTDAVTSVGEHTLTIMIDNRDSFYLSTYGHSYTNETQTIWNGIVGEISLIAKETVYMDEIMVFTDEDSKNIRIKGVFKNYSKEDVSGHILFSIKKHSESEIIAESTVDYTIEEGESDFEYILNINKEITRWNEFTPALYNLSICLNLNYKHAALSETSEVIFGFRNVKVQDRKILLNNKKVYLRGNLECCIHPLTGYPPCDVEYWRNIFNTVKAYGMNHIRFHSNCPPEAAFTAADQVGIYLQIEGPAWLDNWFMELGSHDEHYEFLPLEAERIIKRYSNHPSFCIFCNGNEFRGDFKLLQDIISMLRKIRPDIVYTLTANYDRELDDEDDIFISVEADKNGMRGNGFRKQMAETISTDYSAAVSSRNIPLIAHEGGQYCVYPNIQEIPDYTGNLFPMNFEVIKKELENKNMVHMIDKLVMASGNFAARLYKEEIEAYMRTIDFGGFQLLGIQDFPGQCTATVGLLDSFWKSKNIVSNTWFKEFCNAVVPLVKMDKRIFNNNGLINAEVMVDQFTFEDILNANINWQITYNEDEILAQGSFENINLKAGSQATVGYIKDIKLDSINEPVQLKLSLAIENTEYHNSWDLWVFPDIEAVNINSKIEDYDIKIVHEWNETVQEMLNNGSKVLMLPKKECFINRPTYEGAFYPVFWSPVFFESKTSCGIYCNDHKALRYFPTDSFSNYQWFNLLQYSFNFDIDHLEEDFTPIIEVIPNYYYNHRLTNLLEARVSNGILLICTLQLDAMGDKNETKWFKYSLVEYLNKADARKIKQLSAEQVNSIFYSEKELEEDKINSTESFFG
jgi:hypothetical protein